MKRIKGIAEALKKPDPPASSRAEVRSAGGARRFPRRSGSLRIGRSGWRKTPLPA